MRECLDCSGPSLSADARRHVFAWRSPYVVTVLLSFCLLNTSAQIVVSDRLDILQPFCGSKIFAVNIYLNSVC